MGNPKFQIFKGSGDQFYFRLRAGNGEIILASEGYKSKQSCGDGIASVKSNASNDARYERKDGVHYSFLLKAANGEPIGRSETYTARTARENGITSVKNNAPSAPVEDTTN